MKAILTDRDYEALSAYMDGQLSPGERRKLEERMRARPDLRIAMDDMRRMRTLLRQAPRRRAPRNFTLTPAMVGEPKRRPFQWSNLFPALSFTSALAALALVVIVTLQLGYNPQQAPQTVAMQPPAASQEVGALAAPESPAAEAPVPEAQVREMPAAEEAAPAEPGQEEAFSAKGAGTPETAATPGEEPGIMAAGEVDATLPAIINWNGIPGAPIGGGSNLIPDGRGGAGDVVGLGGGPEMGGMGGGLDGGLSGGIAPGGLYLPPESLESMIEEPAAEEQPSPTQAPVEGGSGPILGVPAAENGGEIIDSQAIIGQAVPTEAAEPTDLAAAQEPESVETAAPGIARVEEQQESLRQQELQKQQESVDQNQPQAAPQPGPAVEDAPQAQSERLLGLQPRTLLILEILLGLITLAAGGAAFLLWKQRTGR